ncbi:membrane protein [Secundilactobacillus pentosiphilus]|uniref:Membrane protein n=1 Tax=Secundilactobacillus pentosiphilus TaxID=1714682 RepID=A0A1Z5IVL1_9LACO|nr:YdcF family protein [Secundilactobacillus pentosiphilus]GAX05638.1 membrane protein [Secundilactobacillus pentosiphilus]
MLIILTLITLANLAAILPLVRGQHDQRLVWGPLISLLIVWDLLICLPLIIWPHHTLATAFSVGFLTWYLTASAYFWLTNWYYRQTSTLKRPDYLIILGAKVTSNGPSKTLVRRLQTALTFCVSQKQPPKLVLTGGQGGDEPQSEAAVMAKYLKQSHVDPNQLLLEQHATSTETNFKFSKQLIENDWHGPGKPRILVVTSDYHLVRSKLLAWRQRLPVQLLGSWTTTAALMPAIMREIAALLLQLKWPLIVIWVLGTLLVQAFE